MRVRFSAYASVMESLTVSSSMLIPSAVNAAITPAMLAVLWGIADELDRRRVSAATTDALWLEMPSKRLRDPDGRNDNFWLRECLDRLQSIQLKGEYRGDPWGAVVVGEYHLTQGGSMCRLLLVPATIRAFRAPETFAKIELTAAYKLKGHARRFYAALSDKKRMGNPYWSYQLGELRSIFGTEDKYPKWHDFNRYVLTPALEEINDYGTVEIKATPLKEGRGIVGVRFDWKWKALDDARETAEENEKHESARRKPDGPREVPPPLAAVDVPPEEPRRKEGTAEERAARSAEIMRQAGFKSTG